MPSNLETTLTTHLDKDELEAINNLLIRTTEPLGSELAKKIFYNAMKGGNDKLILTLLKKNILTQEEISEEFLKFLNFNLSSLSIIPQHYEITIRTLCAIKGQNSPNSDAMAGALKYALLQGNVTLIKLILNHPNLNQQVVNEEFLALLRTFTPSATNSDKEMIKAFCYMEGANKPNLRTMAIAFNNAVDDAIRRDFYDLVDILISNPDTNLSPVSVTDKLAFLLLSPETNRSIIKRLCAMQGRNKPNTEQLQEGLKRISELEKEESLSKNTTLTQGGSSEIVSTKDEQTQNLLSVNQKKPEKSNLPMNMMILGGVIAALGIAAVAIALVLLNAPVLGIVLSIGIAASIAGVGLFAAGAFKSKPETTSEERICLRPF